MNIAVSCPYSMVSYLKYTAITIDSSKHAAIIMHYSQLNIYILYRVSSRNADVCSYRYNIIAISTSCMHTHITPNHIPGSTSHKSIDSELQVSHDVTIRAKL